MRPFVGPLDRQSVVSPQNQAKSRKKITRKTRVKHVENLRETCGERASGLHVLRMLTRSDLLLLHDEDLRAEDLHTLLPPLYLINTILCLTQTAQPAKRSAYMPAIYTN